MLPYTKAAAVFNTLDNPERMLIFMLLYNNGQMDISSIVFKMSIYNQEKYRNKKGYIKLMDRVRYSLRMMAEHGIVERFIQNGKYSYKLNEMYLTLGEWVIKNNL